MEDRYTGRAGGPELYLSDFDYSLPPERIALRPVSPRDSARMLVARDGVMTDAIVRELPDWLAPGDLLVVNNTKVLPVQLTGQRLRDGEDGARPEIGLTLTEAAADGAWVAYAKPGRKLRAGDSLEFGGGATAQVTAKEENGRFTLAFAGIEDFSAFLEREGAMPLPPYIAGKRPADDHDKDDYQTVYAAVPGAVAAPTAGLHFTPELEQALTERGVGRVAVTLHVGAGTFLPVKVDRVADHKMHAEWGEISPEAAEAINRAKAAGGRIAVVGTTSLRLLETAAREGTVQPFEGWTDIFITPGFAFRAADILMTNFHLPRSTLMMLVSAFAGMESIQAAYAHAIAAGYRFYSYGDASLLFRSSS